MDDVELLYYKILGFPVGAIYFCPHGPDDGCDCAQAGAGNWSEKRCAIWDFAPRRSWSSGTAALTGGGGRDRVRMAPAGQASTARRTISSMPLIAGALLTERGGAA